MDDWCGDGAPEMIKCVTKIKNKTNKNNKQNGKRKIKTNISFVSSIFSTGNESQSHEKKYANDRKKKNSNEKENDETEIEKQTANNWICQ